MEEKFLHFYHGQGIYRKVLIGDGDRKVYGACPACSEVVLIGTLLKSGRAVVMTADCECITTNILEFSSPQKDTEVQSARGPLCPSCQAAGWRPALLRDGTARRGTHQTGGVLHTTARVFFPDDAIIVLRWTDRGRAEDTDLVLFYTQAQKVLVEEKKEWVSTRGAVDKKDETHEVATPAVQSRLWTGEMEQWGKWGRWESVEKNIAAWLFRASLAPGITVMMPGGPGCSEALVSKIEEDAIIVLPCE